MLTKYERRKRERRKVTYILLLFENVSDLEPDVGMCERAWGISENAIKASKRIFEFTLLLINNAQTKENLILLVEM